MNHTKGDASLSRKRRSFTVAASPFNVIKLELAIIIAVGFVLLLVHERLVDHPLAQLGILVGYGVVAMMWLVIKTRRISRQLVANEGNDGSSGEHADGKK